MKIKFIFTLFLVGLLPVSTYAQISLNVFMKERGAKIDSLHYGIFFEDINHAADGGLYAELIRNRSFEDCDTVPVYWNLISVQSSANMKLVDDNLLNSVQRKALRIEITSMSKRGRVDVANEGYWGINAVNGRKYKLSFWAKAENYKGTISASLQDRSGQKKYAESKVNGKLKDEWKKYTLELCSDMDDTQAKLVLSMDRPGTVYLDMVSLFPPTFKNRANGCRPELVQLLADMRPRFMRFPGGCFVEGEVINGELEQFKWKSSVGPIEERTSHINVWRYPVTNGLGYHEFLQLAEDLGSTPMYVTNVGVWHGGFASHDSIDWYVQDALDAIEYANGDENTKYGAMRIANGHPEPFGMYLIEIGNENYQKDVKQQSDHYPERYIQFYKAIKEKYPYMQIIGNVEALGTDYPSWRNEHPVDIVDEHYYRSPRWFVDKYNHYDNYNRDSHKIYVGEYAVTREYGVNGNLNAALGEAVFMQGMERNSDVVIMNCYAPIFKNENEARWNPDMIHFNSGEVFVTPSYYVQKLFANNVGDYNVRCVEENNIYPVENYLVKYSDGVDLVVAGNAKRYIARKRFQYTNEQEEIKLYFHYRDNENCGIWHLGADHNRRYNLELYKKGEVSTLAYKYKGLEEGKWYDAWIEVANDTVKCYLDDELIHEVSLYPKQWIYTSASVTSNGETGYLKIVNPTDKEVTIDIDFRDTIVREAQLIRLTSANGTDENSMENKESVKPVDMGPLPVIQRKLKLSIPGFTLDIIKTN